MEDFWIGVTRVTANMRLIAIKKQNPTHENTYQRRKSYR